MFCKEGPSLLTDRWTPASDLEKFKSTDCEYYSEGPQLGPDDHCQKGSQILYLVSLHLQGVIIGTPGLNGLPPITTDSMDSAHQLIPHELLNFLVWITGSQTSLSLTSLWKLVMTSGGVTICCSGHCIYIKKGRKPMPKHVVLGLTIRHMNESSCIIVF